MGKNQAYKAMQRSRLGSSSAGPDEVEDGLVDGSFHSPEWHAARLASLKTSHTVTWEEYKKKQKEEEVKKGELEADKDKMMREYRAQLDAERASKLAQGRNHSGSRSSRRKDRKDKDMKKRSSKKRKNLQVVTMRRENQKGQNQGQRERRKKESPSRDPSTRAAMKRRMGLCHFPDSSGAHEKLMLCHESCWHRRSEMYSFSFHSNSCKFFLQLCISRLIKLCNNISSS